MRVVAIRAPGGGSAGRRQGFFRELFWEFPPRERRKWPGVCLVVPPVVGGVGSLGIAGVKTHLADRLMAG